MMVVMGQSLVVFNMSSCIASLGRLLPGRGRWRGWILDYIFTHVNKILRPGTIGCFAPNISKYCLDFVCTRTNGGRQRPSSESSLPPL
jgi:hypothetical protein